MCYFEISTVGLFLTLLYFSIVKKQLAFMLARQGHLVETEDEDLLPILNNESLSEHFLALAKDLNVAEPKTPEDIYKSHLENVRKQHICILRDIARPKINLFVKTRPWIFYECRLC